MPSRERWPSGHEKAERRVRPGTSVEWPLGGGFADAGLECLARLPAELVPAASGPLGIEVGGTVGLPCRPRQISLSCTRRALPPWNLRSSTRSRGHALACSSKGGPPLVQGASRFVGDHYFVPVLARAIGA
jgi:hypothetical protein